VWKHVIRTVCQFRIHTSTTRICAYTDALHYLRTSQHHIDEAYLAYTIYCTTALRYKPTPSPAQVHTHTHTHTHTHSQLLNESIRGWVQVLQSQAFEKLRTSTNANEKSDQERLRQSGKYISKRVAVDALSCDHSSIHQARLPH
jgi:hypothetical protein